MKWTFVAALIVSFYGKNTLASEFPTVRDSFAEVTSQSLEVTAMPSCFLPTHLHGAKCLGTFVATSSADIESYKNHRGLENGRYKHLVIDFPITQISQLHITTPCNIEVKKNIEITTGDICFANEGDIRVSDAVELKAEAGSLGFYTTDNIILGNKAKVELDDLMHLVARGGEDKNIVRIESGTVVNAGRIDVWSDDRLVIEEFSKLQSTGTPPATIAGISLRVANGVDLEAQEIYRPPITLIRVERRVEFDSVAPVLFSSPYMVTIDRNVKFKTSEIITINGRGFDIHSTVDYGSGTRSGNHLSANTPEANITAQVSPDDPLTYTFSATDSSENGVEVEKYIWDFTILNRVVSSSADNSSVSHTFTYPGKHRAQLTIKNESNHVDVAWHAVDVGVPSAHPLQLVQMYFFRGNELPDTLTGRLGNRDITLSRLVSSANIYTFQVPSDMPAGNYSLTIGTAKYSSNITVLPAIVVEDPDSAIEGRLNTAISLLDAIPDEGNEGLKPSNEDFKASMVNLINYVKAEYEKLSAVEKVQVAILVGIHLKEFDALDILENLPFPQEELPESLRNAQDIFEDQQMKLYDDIIESHRIGIALGGATAAGAGLMATISGTIAKIGGAVVFTASSIAFRIYRNSMADGIGKAYTLENASINFGLGFPRSLLPSSAAEPPINSLLPSDAMEQPPINIRETYLPNLSSNIDSEVYLGNIWHFPTWGYVRTLMISDRESDFISTSHLANAILRMNASIVLTNAVILLARDLVRFGIGFTGPILFPIPSRSKVVRLNGKFTTAELSENKPDASITFNETLGAWSFSAETTQDVAIGAKYSSVLGESSRDFRIKIKVPCLVLKWFNINPRGTYLLFDPEFDPADPPTSLDLVEEGLKPGDNFGLSFFGAYSGEIPEEGHDIRRDVSAVLVNSENKPVSTLNDQFTRHIRPVVTLPSYGSNVPTDIPEDFMLLYRVVNHTREHVQITVPPSASKILFSTNDSKFSDNSDPNGDLRILLSYSVLDIDPRCQQ